MTVSYIHEIFFNKKKSIQENLFMVGLKSITNNNIHTKDTRSVLGNSSVIYYRDSLSILLQDKMLYCRPRPAVTSAQSIFVVLNNLSIVPTKCLLLSCEIGLTTKGIYLRFSSKYIKVENEV